MPKLDLNEVKALKPSAIAAADDGKKYIQCTWCNGKGCKKCKFEGRFCYDGLDEQVEAVRLEIQNLCKNGLKEMMTERNNNGAKPVHKDFLCDMCDKEIVGIRYKCTMRDDYDLCEKCEPKDTEHTFLKIRKPEHAPAKFVCKYGT